MKMTLANKSSFFSIALAALLICAGCSGHGKKGATPFPASNEVSGWTETGDTRTFSAKELWSYIDGDAERYVKAGVQSTSTTEYKFQNKFEANVDVYDMGTSTGARTIFDSETANGAQTVQLGDAGRLYSGSIVFRKGKYLVRLVAYKEGTEVQSALQDLGREIERRLAS